MKKRQPEPITTEKQKSENAKNGKFKKFAYGLAWVNFLAVIGLAVYEAIKDHKPPDKDEYYK